MPDDRRAPRRHAARRIPSHTARPAAAAAPGRHRAPAGPSATTRLRAAAGAAAGAGARRLRPLRWVTPVLGVALVAASALGASAEESSASASSTGSDVLAQRLAVGDRAARSQDRTPAPEAAAAARAAAEAEARAAAEAKAQAAARAKAKAQAAARAKAKAQAAARLVGGFPAVRGCAAKVPARGSVANGQLPADGLCPIGGGESLRADAASAFVAMNKAFSADFGKSICITDSYRSLAEQKRVYATKPHLAAYPGTSEHGWGMALDLGCGIQSFGTPVHEWLLAHGRKYGWISPAWARPGGSRPEPWHWEYDPSLVA